MAIFIGIHKTGPVDEEIFANGWEKYKEASSKMGMKAVKVMYNAAQGVGVCETEAQSAEQVKAAHEEVGMVPQEIIEVKVSE